MTPRPQETAVVRLETDRVKATEHAFVPGAETGWHKHEVPLFGYMLAGELPSTGVYLRLSKARNGQVKRTRDASDYRDPWRMFGPTALGGEQPSNDC